jgi:hypothetical protein
MGEEPPIASAEPLVLELGMLYGAAEFGQEIVVTENSDFHVRTRDGSVRWLVEGHIGRIENGIAVVNLRYGAYNDPQNNIHASTRAELPLDEPTWNGLGDFHLMLTGLWLRRGLDPVPVLARSVARRASGMYRAIYRLGALGPEAKAAVPELIAVLNDADIDKGRPPYESIRRGAAESLGKIGPDASAAADSLQRLMGDDNPYVRLDSALALWSITSRTEAVTVAADHLTHQDRYVRYEAAHTLEAMGPDAAAAAPALSAALTSDDGDLRIDAASALWAIRRDPAALTALRDVGEHHHDRKTRERATAVLGAMEEQQSEATRNGR